MENAIKKNPKTTSAPADVAKLINDGAAVRVQQPNGLSLLPKRSSSLPTRSTSLASSSDRNDNVPSVVSSSDDDDDNDDDSFLNRSTHANHVMHICDECMTRCDEAPHYKCMECDAVYVCLDCWQQKYNHDNNHHSHRPPQQFWCKHKANTFIYQAAGTLPKRKRIIDTAASRGVGRQTLQALQQFATRPLVVDYLQWEQQQGWPENARNNKPWSITNFLYVPFDQKATNENMLLSIKAYWTYEQLGQAAKALLYGLHVQVWQTNMECFKSEPAPPPPPVTQVALWMSNNVPWTITDVALAIGGYCVAPIDAQADPTTAAYILHKAECHTLVIQATLLAQLQRLDRNKLEYLKHIVVVPDGSSELDLSRLRRDFESYTFDSHKDLIELGNKAECLDDAIDCLCVSRSPDDVFTLIFTSGSTGTPKGVIQTHYIWREYAFSSWGRSRDLLVSAVFMPLCYSTARHRFWHTLGNGGRLALLPNADNIFDKLPRIGPTFFSGPPLVFHSLYTQFQRDWKACTAQIDIDNIPSAFSDKVQGMLTRARRSLLKVYSLKVGTRCGYVGVGGAKSSDGLLAFLKECFVDVGKISFSNSYGTSEGGGGLFDGCLTRGTDAILLDVPEMGFFAKGEPMRGELCLYAKRDTPGYWKEPELTNNLFQEFQGKRYLRTGDIVEIRDGKIHIIDRRSNIIKASNGVFLSPEHLETVFLSSCNKFVQHVFVYMEPSWSFPLAVVSTVHPDVTEQDVLKAFRKAALEAGIRAVPHGVIISKEPFSAENKLLTVSMKLARHSLRLHFQDQLRALHAKLQNSTIGLSSQAPQAANTLEQLKDTYKAVIRVSEAGQDDTAELLGADSITIIQLRDRIQEDFRVRLTIQNLWSSNMMEVGKMIEAGSNNVIGGAGTFTVQPVQFPSPLKDSFVDRVEASRQYSLDDVGLSENSVSTEETTELANASQTTCHVLLTGVTGFIGQSVLSSLLSKDESIRVTCLIRATDDMEALKRLKAVNAELCILDDGARVDFVRGDLTESNPPLGLSCETRKRLRNEITTVVHCGAYVNHTMPFTELEACNVASVRHLVNLFGYGSSERSKLRRFVHVSSVSVDSLSETTLDRKPGPAKKNLSINDIHNSNGYALSKWAAESLLQNVQESFSNNDQTPELDVVVVRCGMTSWHTSSGIGNLNDWLCKWCHLVALTKQYPVANHLRADQVRWLELVPVDWTADVLAECATARSSTNAQPLTHLYNPHLLDINSKIFKPLGAKPVPFDTWRATLKRLVGDHDVTSEISRLAITLLSLYPSYKSLPGVVDRLHCGGSFKAFSQEPGTLEKNFEDDRLCLEFSVDRFVTWIQQQIPQQ